MTRRGPQAPPASPVFVDFRYILLLSPYHKPGKSAASGQPTARMFREARQERAVRVPEKADGGGTNRRTEGRRLMSGRTAYLGSGPARYGR